MRLSSISSFWTLGNLGKAMATFVSEPPSAVPQGHTLSFTRHLNCNLPNASPHAFVPL